MYTIEIRYTTGNSFESSQETDYVGMAWKDMSKAQEALERIIEHNAMVKYSESFRSMFNRKLTQKQFDYLTKKPWFYSEKQATLNLENICNEVTWKIYLIVQDDNDKDVGINAFWIGHFEDLISAKVILYNTLEYEYDNIRQNTEQVLDHMNKLN